MGGATRPTPSTAPPRARTSSRSTPRRPRSAARCTWARCSATPRPTRSPATSGCAARCCSTRWAGTTTACRPSAGCRTTSASGATRRCPTTRAFDAARRSRAKDPVSISRRNFVELCLRLTAEDEKAFEHLWRTLGLSRRLGADLHDHRPGDAADQPARVPAQPRPRRGLRRRVAHPLGRRLPHRRRAGRARGPRDARAPTTGSASSRRRSSSRPPAPSCCRPASPWSPTPTTSATSRCSVRR